MLTRPVIALEYYDGKIDQDNYNKGNLLNSGINVSKIKNDRGRSQNVAPVLLDQSQAGSASVAEINLKAVFKADLTRQRNWMQKMHSMEKLNVNTNNVASPRQQHRNPQVQTQQ